MRRCKEASTLAAITFAPKCFEEQTPPAWWEDEVSGILDAAAGRVDGRAGDACLLLQSHWEKSVPVELVSFGIDRFNLEDEVEGAAKRFSSEGDGLAYGGLEGLAKAIFEVQMPPTTDQLVIYGLGILCWQDFEEVFLLATNGQGFGR